MKVLKSNNLKGMGIKGGTGNKTPRPMKHPKPSVRGTGKAAPLGRGKEGSTPFK